MAGSQFTSPLKAGTIREGASDNSGFGVMVQSGLVAFGDDGTTTAVCIVPAGSQIAEVYVDVLTAFDAATTNTFSIGDGTTADLFAAALDVSSAGRVLASSDASQLANYDDVGTSDVTITVTYNQTGAAATAGSARVTVLYAPSVNLE